MATSTETNPEIAPQGPATLAAPVEQLMLFTSSGVPSRFHIDRRTRELGLARIAEIKRQMAARNRPAEGGAHRAA